MDVLGSAIAAAAKALERPGEPGPDAAAALQQLCDALAEPKLVGQLSPTEAGLRDLCHKTALLLAKPSTSAEVLESCHGLLSQLAQHNARLRTFLARELGLASSAYEALRHSLRAQSGPQQLLQSLRLLLLLTAEPGASLGSAWTPDLLHFLLKEICRETKAPDAEWLPFCLGILNNLVRHFPEHRQWLGASDRLSGLGKRLMGLLASQSRPVVIYSLSLITFLEQRLTETVFSKKNLSQTLPCIINVVLKGDELLARSAAVDVLVRMGVGEGAEGGSEGLCQAYARASLSPVGKGIVAFPGLGRTLGPVATSLVHLSQEPDQLLPLLQLFLSFSAVEELRSPALDALLNADPVQSRRLKTPLLALVDVALPSPSSSANPLIPIYAQRLIRTALEKVSEDGRRMGDFVAGEPLVELVQTCVKTPLEGGRRGAAAEAERVAEGLRLARAMAADEDLRSDVLDVVSGALCAHVSEFQLLGNPIAAGDGQGAGLREPWAVLGVWVMVELLQLLAALKDHSGAHKQQYWRLLKDERLVPLLAFGVASGQAALVAGALSLLRHCGQNDHFQWDRLSRLIASVANALRLHNNNNTEVSAPSSNGHGQGPTLSNGNGHSAERETAGLSEEKSAELDAVLARLRTELAKGAGDGRRSGEGWARVSEVVQMYEAKLGRLTEREREMGELLGSKDQLVSQTERLLSQSSSQRREAEAEATRLRELLRQGERGRESELGRLKAAQADKDRELAGLAKELEEERGMSEKFRSNYKEMKEKFEAVSGEVLEAKAEAGRRAAEVGRLERAGKEARREAEEAEGEARDLRQRLRDAGQAQDAFKRDLAKAAATIARLQRELQENQAIVDSISKLTTKASHNVSNK